ncbi:hypothetical protein JXA32_04040 [Candidatus Sumerlaeota bacterium]|nr:hypothetical protein [Candidatus Sumerlaeota bacterium]
MPYKITYLDEEGGVITEYWGTVTDDDIIESGRKKSSALERLKSYRYALTDLSRVDQFDLSTRGIQGNVDVTSEVFKVNRNLIVAFVLPTNVEYGMGRMWQAYADEHGVKSHVCRTREEAEAWIKHNIKP